MIKISVCVPFYRRPDLVMQTIKPLIYEDRVDEIILSDDYSPLDEYHKLIENTKDIAKIRIVRGVRNFHVQHAKRNAISFSKNEWCVILDNDNIIDSNFIDRLYDIPQWIPDVIYHPAFASPRFDYRIFNGMYITKENIHTITHHDILVTLLNTNNYMCNRDAYLFNYKYDSSIRGADGIFFAYNWLMSGNQIYVVPELSYFHRVHEGSEFLNEKDNNMRLIYSWFDNIKKLR
jgi:glycosyltransferase involved in cell wall biosynthesis